MNRQSLWHVPLLTGLVVGVGLGLIYTWLISPVQYYDTTPDKLRPDLKDEYILLIAESLAADSDWPAARKRLDQLRDPELAGTVLALAERAIQEGRSVSTVRHLAIMASNLGASSPALGRFIPTRMPTPSPTRQIISTIASPTPPPLPTVTPTPAPTSQPTFTPSPIPTPPLRYRLLAQQPICDPNWPRPRIQVVVRDAEGNDLAGIEVIFEWDTQSTGLFTGFKPELGHGYVDLTIESDVSYAVRLAAGSQVASGIQAVPCTSRDGPRLLSTRLVYELLESAP